jgi:hypothetical protein
MEMCGCCNIDGIDIGLVEHVIVRGVDFGDTMFFGKGFGAFLREIADCDDFGIGMGLVAFEM